MGGDDEALAALERVARLSGGHDAAGVGVARGIDQEVRAFELAGRVLVRGGKLAGGAARDLD